MICADTGAPQQDTEGNSPAGLPQADQDKIQLIMKRTDIKINSPAMRFSKTMMEMKRNKNVKSQINRMLVPGRGSPWRRRTG